LSCLASETLIAKEGTIKSQMTMGKKLMLSFGAVLAVVVFLSVAALSAISSLKTRFDDTAGKTARKIVLVDNINTAVSNMLAAQRGLIVMRYAKDFERAGTAREMFRKNVDAINKDLEEMRPLVVLPEVKQITEDMAKELPEWVSTFSEIDRLCESGNPDAAWKNAKGIGLPIYQKIGSGAARVTEIQRDLLDKDRQAAAELNTRSRLIVLSAIGFGVLLGIVGFWTVRQVNQALRRAAAELAEGAEQISSAASQVASSSQSLAQGASEQAASLEETSASSEEITSMTRKNSENSQSAADVMATVDQHVKEGNRTLEQMVVSMSEINASSDKISKIIKVIDEIAFQTNILALNAAVEAARAGEAGMGFAVVADEVRNLAQRSAQAAKDTAGLIEESIAKSNEGSSKLQQVTEVIRAITESSSKVKMLVDEVNLGSQEQARGIDQIAKAVSQMDQVTQSTAANAEESASASEELSAQAEALNQVVMQLQTLVGGGSGQHGGAIASTHRRPAPAAPVHKRSLNALKSAVSRPKARARAEAVVPAGKPDRSSFPLEDNFTEM
jgi:methyl-accepting chemotaxis protein/methyl-accepting chemotaxis protein-1 (serine sensor receptor)